MFKQISLDESRDVLPIRLLSERMAKHRMIRKVHSDSQHAALEVRVAGAWRRFRIVGRDHRGIAVKLTD